MTRELTTRNASTRFMNGYRCDELLDIFTENCDYATVMTSDLDLDNAIISGGFKYAIERGLNPIFESITPSYKPLRYGEYHHMIIGDECYNVYFE